jgi:hypothetical protein
LGEAERTRSHNSAASLIRPACIAAPAPRTNSASWLFGSAVIEALRHVPECKQRLILRHVVHFSKQGEIAREPFVGVVQDDSLIAFRGGPA